MILRIEANKKPVDARVELPASKSVNNRLLIVRALAGGNIQGMSDADDTRILDRLLTEQPAVLDCGEGGTTFRFLLAWACMQAEKEFLVTGSERLLARPQQPLVDALRQCGADLVQTDKGYQVRGSILKGGRVEMMNAESSQFVSALLLIAPYMQEGLELLWKGKRLSEPYVHMTMELMRRVGARIDEEGDMISVLPGTYQAMEHWVPKDWSAASFFYMLVAGQENRTVRMPGLFADGLQGDEAIAEVLNASVLTESYDGGTMISSSGKPKVPEVLDLRNTPDLFPPLAMLMACADLPCRFTGLDNLQLKESDRIAALAHMLEACDARLRTGEGEFELFTGVQHYDGHPLPTFNDHRMAMALVKLADRFGSVAIADTGVVSKSFPRFWEELGKLGFRCNSLNQ